MTPEDPASREGLVERLRRALDFDAANGSDRQWSDMLAEAENAAAELERQAALIEAAKRGIVEAAIPLEAAILAGKSPYMSDALWDGIVTGAGAARATLAKLEGAATIAQPPQGV